MVLAEITQPTIVCVPLGIAVQNVEALIEISDMSSEETNVHKELRPSQICDSEADVNKVADAICSFTNPFDT